MSEATELFRTVRDRLLGWYGDHHAAAGGVHRDTEYRYEASRSCARSALP